MRLLVLHSLLFLDLGCEVEPDVTHISDSVLDHNGQLLQAVIPLVIVLQYHYSLLEGTHMIMVMTIPSTGHLNSGADLSSCTRMIDWEADLAHGEDDAV